MTQQLWIPGPLPGLNELLATARSRRGKGSAYSALKAEWGQTVWALAKSAKLQPMPTPVHLSFLWVERDRRRDPDNVAAGGRKLTLDGLVKAGVLPDDGAAEVHGWTDIFIVDKKKPGLLVTIES